MYPSKTKLFTLPKLSNPHTETYIPLAWTAARRRTQRLATPSPSTLPNLFPRWFSCWCFTCSPRTRWRQGHLWTTVLPSLHGHERWTVGLSWQEGGLESWEDQIMPCRRRAVLGAAQTARGENSRVSSPIVRWLLNVPATCECISGTDLLRKLSVVPHWDRSCRSNFLPHPVTVYWHRAD